MKNRDHSNDILKKDNSLKKLLNRDESTVLPTNRSKKDQEPLKPVLISKQKVQEIYNYKPSNNKMILYQSGDKKVKSIDPHSRNYILINSGKV